MKHWEITRTAYKVSDFISWQKTGTLVLSPSFQRRPVWKLDAKSYLIDTIVRGLPMPIIILRDKKTDLSSLLPKREVVDGQQRLRTVLSYVDSSLLSDFNPGRDSFTVLKTHNEEIAGLNFNNLPDDIKNQILEYQFSVHVLPAQVDDREVLQIFERLNATGLKLSRQELRNAEYLGEFKTSVYELAAEQLYRWRDWKVFNEYEIARMEEVELTSEFAIIMIKGIIHKSNETIDNIYKQYDTNFIERSEIERRLRTVMDTIDTKLGSEMKYLQLRRKTLIYNLFAFIYDVQFGIGSPMAKTRPRPITPDIVARIKLVCKQLQDKTAPIDVLEAVARRTTNPGSRRTVINYLHGIKQ